MQTKHAVSKMFRALGTVNSIYLPHCDNFNKVLMAADRVMELDERLSVFKPTSEISLINRNSGIGFTEVQPDTMQLLKRALYFSQITDGVFDVTSEPLVDLWGFGRKQSFVPSNREIDEARQIIGYQDIIFEGNRVMLKKKGQSICLGGIAKGYAADEVKRILTENNVTDALINLGGNIIAMGCQNDETSWTIGIQNPTKKTGSFFGTIKLQDETSVTSGSNEQYFIKNGVRYHHILDPRTGRPADTDLLSVTIIGDNSADMDALATSVFILGMDKGHELLERNHAEAIFVRTDGSVFLTRGLYDRFHHIKDYGAINHACL